MEKLNLKIQKFIVDNFTNIMILLIAMVVLNFLEKFPYFNTFLSFPYPWNSFLLLFLLTVVLFKLNETFSFGTALVCLTIASAFSIFGRDSLAQAVGTIVYVLLWFGLLQMAVRMWRTRNLTHEKE